MSNARKIVIMADAASGDSPLDNQSLSHVRFRRGDDLLIETTFLQNGIVADMSAAQSAVLEILDIGSMNSPDPRTVSLLMRKEVVEFANPICNSEGKLDLEAQGQVPHAIFKFSNLETQISSGERWLTLRVEFSDGSKLSFASGWIFVEENFISDPELLPIENPQYIKRDEAGVLFLNKSANLSDLESKDLARSNLDIYSKSETKSLISDSLEFLPLYKEELESIKNDVENAKDIAISATAEVEKSLEEISSIGSDLEEVKADAEAAKFAAEAAADEAKAISDPDGLLQKHDSKLTELQSGKVGVGEHLFNVGKLRTCSPIKALPLSLCVTVESYDWDKMGVNPFGDKNTGGCCFYNSYGITNWTSPYILKGIRIGITKYAEEDYRLSISMGYNDTQANGTRIICFAKVPLEAINGKHTYIFAINESVINKSSFFADGFYFAIDGVRYEAIQQYTFKIPYNDLGSSGEYARVNTTYNFTSDSEESHFQGSILYYDLKLFNFDITADGAPYTVQDYVEGVQPSLLLKQSTLSTTDPTLGASTGTGWNITTAPSPTVTNGDWKAGQYVSYLKNRTDDLPDGASYAVDLKTSSGIGGTATQNLFCNSGQSLNDFRGKTIVVRITGWIRKNNDGAKDASIGIGYTKAAIFSDSDYIAGVWTKIEGISNVEVTSLSYVLPYFGIAAEATAEYDYSWSFADIKVEVLGEVLELADSRNAYQIKDLSGNGNHATIFGDVISRKNEDPTTMQVEYAWGAGVSTGAYIMGDTATLPANAEIEVLAKSSASATLSLGTSSSASTTFANAASVGTMAKSIAKFYTADTAQKLFATPSVAGLTIKLTLKITSLK